MSIRKNENGGARAKLIIFLLVVLVVGYLGYLYIPVSVDAYYYQDFMQNRVDLGAVQGNDSSWLKDQLTKAAPDYHVPENAIITPAQKEGRLEVRVQFTRPIQTPFYTYNYEFDHTARSAGFLLSK